MGPLAGAVVRRVGVALTLWVGGLVGVLGLAACQGSTSAAGVAARMATVLVAGQPEPTPTLQPGLRYLQARLNNEGNTYLVLGEVDAHPNGEALVWYSGVGQTVVTVDGRLVATRGLPLDWLAVRAAGAPSWAQIAASTGALRYDRERDVMPGYRLGLKEQVSAQRLPGLQDGRVVLLERAQSTAGEVLESRFEFVPDQWREPVRSVQCMAAGQCLVLQAVAAQQPPTRTAR